MMHDFTWVLLCMLCQVGISFRVKPHCLKTYVQKLIYVVYEIDPQYGNMSQKMEYIVEKLEMYHAHKIIIPACSSVRLTQQPLCHLLDRSSGLCVFSSLTNEHLKVYTYVCMY